MKWLKQILKVHHTENPSCASPHGVLKSTSMGKMECHHVTLSPTMRMLASTTQNTPNIIIPNREQNQKTGSTSCHTGSMTLFLNHKAASLHILPLPYLISLHWLFF
eukprot:Hpha_TRINITY_DN16501_c2_g2::TRINITY_DN16501_c2_g2_i1::g.137188::m.137188